MRVFLSWSGVRSLATAEALRDWLPKLINAVEPWMSGEMEKGRRWESEIAIQLEESKVGIICLNRQNLHEDWILFEAGALSKTKDAYVCTFLLDITPADVEQPLAQFQHTGFEKGQLRQLVHTVNKVTKAAGQAVLSDAPLDELFDTLWPQFEERLQKIKVQAPQPSPPVRDVREIVEEILAIVRDLRRSQTREEPARGLERLLDVQPPPPSPFAPLRFPLARLSDLISLLLGPGPRSPELEAALISSLIERGMRKLEEKEETRESEPQK